MNIRIPNLALIEWVILIAIVLILIAIPIDFKNNKEFVRTQIEKCESMGGFALTNRAKTKLKSCSLKGTSDG